jgi:hypothetical protein
VAPAVTLGDLASTQGRFLDGQGQREFRLSTQGEDRWEVFSIPLVGAELPGGDTPGMEAVLTAEVDCSFAYAFHDEPFLKSSLSLMDGEEWGLNGEEAMHSYATACVVNWRRVKNQQLIIGAKVALAVYDYPIRQVGFGMRMMARLAFRGPSSATPLVDDLEFENSTSGPSWVMADWLL